MFAKPADVDAIRRKRDATVRDARAVESDLRAELLEKRGVSDFAGERLLC